MDEIVRGRQNYRRTTHRRVKLLPKAQAGSHLEPDERSTLPSEVIHREVDDLIRSVEMAYPEANILELIGDSMLVERWMTIDELIILENAEGVAWKLPPGEVLNLLTAKNRPKSKVGAVCTRMGDRLCCGDYELSLAAYIIDTSSLNGPRRSKAISSRKRATISRQVEYQGKTYCKKHGVWFDEFGIEVEGAVASRLEPSAPRMTPPAKTVAKNPAEPASSSGQIVEFGLLSLDGPVSVQIQVKPLPLLHSNPKVVKAIVVCLKAKATLSTCSPASATAARANERIYRAAKDAGLSIGHCTAPLNFDRSA